MASNTRVDYKNEIIYSVFPRNFSEEGTFKAVEKKLQHIKELGTGIIWLLPVHPVGEVRRKGSLGSPYAIKDFRAINPEYGTIEDFRSLINKTHQLGMKLIIDVVYNHTSPDSVLAAEHPEWFYRDDTGIPVPRHPDWWDVVDLNYDNPELWDYQIETLKQWVREGVDGFRCDVASVVPLKFWERAKKETGEINPELIWLAESVHPSFIRDFRSQGGLIHSDPEIHQVFDISYDYDGFENLLDYFAGKKTLDYYIRHLYVQETLYPPNSWKMRFLENHDNERISDIFSSLSTVRNWTVFYQLLNGPSLIYNGQEYACRHRPDLFEKEPLQTDEFDHEFYRFFKKTAEICQKIRKTTAAPDIRFLTNDVLLIERKNHQGTYRAIVNLNDRFGSVETDLNLSGTDHLSGKTVRNENRFILQKEPLILFQKHQNKINQKAEKGE